MTLRELSYEYQQHGDLIALRIKELRAAAKEAEDSETKNRLERRMAELTPMLTQMNELAELTAHYYERGYWRGEKYTL